MTTAQLLTAERVDSIFRDCLFANGEDTSGHVMVKGVTREAWFHPERLKGHEAEIVEMLSELPDDFKAGGMSFTAACFDRHNRQWTGFHGPMEYLFMLGLALGKVKEPLPRKAWKSLPGGVPYYAVVG